jgi:hypothetical protein
MSDAQSTSRRSCRDSIRERVPTKLHVWLLSLIVLVGLLRGGYWVATTEFWNPIDEAQHYSYVEFMAHGHLPVVGEDKLQLDVLGVAKTSPTLGLRSAGPTVSKDSDWGIFGQQYEGAGYQGPLYYALLVPAYWLAHPFGTIATIYVLRVATLLILLTSVPLLWLLARELFPKHPAVWLAAPAILVAIQGFDANTTSITNDALVVPIAIAALIPVASAWRGINNGQAAIGGLLFGLAMLTKNTAVPVAALAAIVLAGLLLIRRETLRNLVVWGLVYSAAAALVLFPYVTWNLATYGSFSANSRVNDIIAPLQPHVPRTLAGLRAHFKNACTAFWDLQSHTLGVRTAYALSLEAACVIAVVAGMAGAFWRRSYRDATALGWAAIAFPVAFVTVLVGTLASWGGAGALVGRHVYAALGLVSIAMAAGLIIGFGSRVGVLAIVLVLGIAFIRERELTHHYLSTTYSDGVVNGRLAPVVDQPLNEGYASAASVSATANCPVEAVGLAIVNPAPKELTLSSPSTQQATYFGENKSVSIYALPAPTSGQITMLTSGLSIGKESVDRDPDISLAGATGDPVVRLYCAVDNPDEFRFKQMFYPGHVDLSYGLVRAWADIWYWIGWALVAAGLAGMAALAYAELRAVRR